LHARTSVLAFVVAIAAVPLIAASTGGASDGSAIAEAAASDSSTSVVTEDAPQAAPSRAIAGLSNGHELRAEADAAVQAQAAADAEAARADAEADARAEASSTTSAAAEAPTTAAPTTAAPTTAPPAPPTTASAPSVPSGVWDAIAACESGGNWAINTGNGYYGGLQFLLSTWQIHGGAAFAPYPHQATREQQIAIGERVVAAAGGSYGAWGGCAASLGLP
jgi:hypothetical protein